MGNNCTHGDAELQLYVANAIQVSGGLLRIDTRKQQVRDQQGKLYNYTSGWIDTKGKWAQEYGRIVVRAKLPAQNSTGAWPAHWLMPEPASCPGTNSTDHCCWPKYGEVDIMEYTGNPLLNRVFGSFRWGRACGSNEQELPGAAWPPLEDPTVDLSGTFHEYGVDWDVDSLAFHVDGQVYHTRNRPSYPVPQWPMHMILNTAVAWYYPPWLNPDAVWPAEHVIDWVKAW